MMLEMTIVFIGMVFVMLVLLYDTLSAAHDDRLKSALDAQEKEYYFTQCRLMQESVEQTKAARHDMMTHLAAIKGYAQENKVSAIIDYLDALLGTISETKAYSNTGNIAFDSIINYKLKYAKQENIQLAIRLAIPPAINIALSDTAIILGNLLDNALDAVAKLPEKEIKLDIEYSRQALFIHVKNSYDGIVSYAAGPGKGEKRIASRKDGSEHGHGLKNIKRAIEKYNGHMDIAHEAKTFSVTILLYIDAGCRRQGTQG